MELEKELLMMSETQSGVETGQTFLHVICGSRTGNSLAAGRLAHEYANHLGIKSQLHDMKTIDPDQVAHIRNMLIAVSTHGEGDPPAVVEDFYNFMHSPDAPSMKGTRFSVLALGDSSYKDYCKTGHDFRKRLLELGSEEISPLVECDIDYEENAMNWVREAVASFENILPKTGIINEKEFAFEINKIETGSDGVYYAEVKDIQLLTSPDFLKRTFHLVLSVEKFASSFFPGDSFGIYAHNSRLLVDKLLKNLRFDGTHALIDGKSRKLLKEALISDYEITVITPVVVEKYAELIQSNELTAFISDKSMLGLYCETSDVLDLVTDFPSEISPEDFVSILRKLNPRLYSVANSPQVFPDEVHFTVGLMEYDLKNRRHSGVCTTYFSDRINIGDTIPVFLEANENFRITDEDSKPVIMIATGTGIAPFRGFLQYRDHKKATGDNWLFFGDRHAESDFLYQNELEDYLEKGILTRLNTAFSRDQAEKIYVQHQMLENSKELFHWINDRNAEIYLCGNKRTMGKDVRETLALIVANQGRLSPAKADEYLQNLRTEKRLKTDLY
jgi:sulfite reductase (NADPH) flavoprotein alpha-component